LESNEEEDEDEEEDEEEVEDILRPNNPNPKTKTMINF
jgi:hypothetical protein